MSSAHLGGPRAAAAGSYLTTWQEGCFCRCSSHHFTQYKPVLKRHDEDIDMDLHGNIEWKDKTRSASSSVLYFRLVSFAGTVWDSYRLNVCLLSSRRVFTCTHRVIFKFTQKQTSSRCVYSTNLSCCKAATEIYTRYCVTRLNVT